MKPKVLLLLTSGAFALAAVLAFTGVKNVSPPPTVSARSAALELKIKNMIRCTPDWEVIGDLIEKEDIPPLPGWGSHKWKISTKSDSAQFYFNQGMTMYYGFHIIESMASFKKAARFDSTCAVLWWAQALAYGPNINDPAYAAPADALEATANAMRLSGRASKVEKDLIDAMSVRYSSDTTKTRAALNQAYTDKMKTVFVQNSTHPDTGPLYVDAMMLEHPWDLWHTNGTPKPWTPRIRLLLENLLKKYPNHPGLNHYYVHVMEPSPYFAKALASADRLGKLTPGISHMVHMPSHIYLRSGQYSKGSTVNDNAVKAYSRYEKLLPSTANNVFLYVWHNEHMDVNCAMMAAKKEHALQKAISLQSKFDSATLATPGALGSYIQYIYMTPTLAMIRFEQWEQLLQQPQPAEYNTYARILYHFGRGMAMANTSDLPGAEKELAALQELMKNDVLQIPFSPYSAAIEGATVAEQLLQGTIAMNEKNYSEAENSFRKAVTVEEQMIYNEPRDWLLNPAPYLGNALLAAKKYTEAEKAFRKDLAKNEANCWALYGLYKSQEGQKKITEAQKTLDRVKKASAASDFKIAAGF